jgi:hypothetical protein
MVDRTGQELRVLAWASAVLAVAAIITTLLLPGTQAFLCRSGVRLACDRHDMKIDEFTFRHQWIPHGADGIAMLAALASRSPPDVSSVPPELFPHASSDKIAPSPIHCNESEDSIMAMQEQNFRRAGGGT